MNSGVRERIELPGGQAYRVLRWTENLHDVDVILTPDRSVRISGEGEHRHFHQALELTLFRAGEGTQFVGDRITPFERGALVLIGENLPHHWRARGRSAGICVQWDFPAGHPMRAFPEAQALSELFKAASHGIDFHGETARVLTERLQEMAATASLDRLGLLLRLLATAAAAPARDYSLLSTKPFHLPTEAHHQLAMRDAMQYLVAHFRGEVRMEQLLEVTRMSKATFCRQFKNHFGKSLQEFLQQVRLNAACQELRATDHPIIDVALSSGFSQLSFFNLVFRRAFKCSPTRFRQGRRSRAT